MSIYIFGEVLWDVYPEKKVLGGAPFNFAAHLRRLGADARLVTAVGKDELGNETLKAIDSYNLNKDFISVIDYPTGICQVTISSEGIPTYDLCPCRAYDNIPVTTEQNDIIKETAPKSLYFGTLAQREPTSRATLKKLVSDHSWDNVFFDINIRQSYYTREIAEDGFKACTVLKISREEFPVLAELGICSVNPNDFEDKIAYYNAVCKHLADTYNIGTILLTLDKDGAMSYTKHDGKTRLSHKPEGQVISTVGAGDSFFAAYTHAYLAGKAPDVCLSHAVILSDYVVQNLESVPEYTEELLKRLTD